MEPIPGNVGRKGCSLVEEEASGAAQNFHTEALECCGHSSSEGLAILLIVEWKAKL